MDGGPSNRGRGPDLTACLVGLRSHSWSHRGRCLTRTGLKYVGSSFCTESLRINVGYTNSFSICFFVNTYDTVHIVLIKIHIAFTIAYSTYWACGEFFSRKSVAHGRSITPFFWAKRLHQSPLYIHGRGDYPSIRWIVKWAGNFKAQRASRFQWKEAASKQHQLLSTCVKLKSSCQNVNFKTTKYTKFNTIERFKVCRLSSVVRRPSSVVCCPYLLSSHVSTLVHRISKFYSTQKVSIFFEKVS
jgi:hypothetical protein